MKKLVIAKSLVTLMFAAAPAVVGCKKEEPVTPPPKTPTTPAPPTRPPTPQASASAGGVGVGAPGTVARGVTNPLAGTGIPAADAREDLRQAVTSGDAAAQAKLAQVTAAIDRKDFFTADAALKSVEASRTSLSPAMQRTVQDLRSRLNALLATTDNRPPASLPATRPG